MLLGAAYLRERKREKLFTAGWLGTDLFIPVMSQQHLCDCSYFIPDFLMTVEILYLADIVNAETGKCCRCSAGRMKNMSE